jgi:hypothetical protein
MAAWQRARPQVPYCRLRDFGSGLNISQSRLYLSQRVVNPTLIILRCWLIEEAQNEMVIEPKSSDVAIVLLGSFNPAIFNPDWLVLNGVIGKTQAEVREIGVITPQVSEFRVSSYHYQVTPQRMQVLFESAPVVELQDTVSKIFQELLPHTPVQQLGINRSVHFSVGSEEKRNEIGRKLAPPEPWGRWSEEWKDRLPPNRAGMTNLAVHEVFPGDPHDRRMTATVQPSMLIADNAGIFAAINDNYVLTEKTGFAAASLLTEKFESSVQRCEWIIDQIMRLKEPEHV